MSYNQDARKEAEEVKKTLSQLDALLKNDKLETVYATNASELRANVFKLLSTMEENLAYLIRLDEDDIFGTDPTISQQRYKVIRLITRAKVEFETEVVPALEKLTGQLVEKAKALPPSSFDVSKLPPDSSGDRWTIEKVVSTAEHWVEQGKKAAGIATKGYALTKALGLLFGIPLP